MKQLILTICTTVACLSAIALNPVREYEITPEDYGMEFSEISIPTEDEEITLFGWFFDAPEKDSKKLVIISDDGDGNMADNLEMVSNYLSLGYNVITYDYRGYGKSSDFTVKSKFFIYSQFHLDLKAVMDYSKKNHNNLIHMDLYGVGIGASLSICSGVNNSYVRRVVADGPYCSLEQVKNNLGKTGESVLMPLGFNKTDLEPEFAITEKGSHLGGMLIIVAEKDPVTSYKELQAIFKGAKVKPDWYVLKGATTNKANFSSGTNAYFQEVKDFLGQ